MDAGRDASADDGVAVDPDYASADLLGDCLLGMVAAPTTAA